jgi:hypothetical protein
MSVRIVLLLQTAMNDYKSVRSITSEALDLRVTVLLGGGEVPLVERADSRLICMALRKSLSSWSKAWLVVGESGNGCGWLPWTDSELR